MLIFLAEMKNSTSLPKEFDDRMRTDLGEDYLNFINSLKEPSPVSIRLNPQKSTPISGPKIPWTKLGKYLDKRPSFTLDPDFHAGAYYVQEASSMMLEQALMQSLDLTKSLRVLDLSAAPGGKSTHLLSLLSSDSLLVSNEVIRSRAYILSENIQKWGYPNVMITCNDPKDFNSMEGFFDAIIVDAPCSGEGLFRKDSEAMNEWSTDHVQLCSMRQRRILSDVLPSLKENGVLVYSTCTYNEQENENNLIWASTENAFDFIPLTMNKDWGVETIQKENAIGYRCYPHKVKGEGFFISVLRKKSNSREVKIKPKRRFSLASKKIIQQLSTWQLQADQFNYIQQENLLITLPTQAFEDIQFLAERLNVITKGTAVAEVKHDKLIPEHSMALSIYLNKDQFQKIDLTLDQALLYLRKEMFSLDDHRKGFAFVSHGENALGWVNLLGTRLNNLYPSAWRIRMTP